VAAEVALKVKEAMQGDVGRGIARIPDDAMRALSAETGDVLEIVGKGGKAAAAIAWKARPGEDSAGFVRLDGILRHNSGAGIDDEVKARRADAKPAREVHLSPEGEASFAPDFASFLQERLLNWPLVAGNSVMVEVLGRPLVFCVSKTSPKGTVQVAPGTKVFLSRAQARGRPPPGIRYEDIGGLKEETESIREMVEIPMRHPEVFKRLGISPPKGVLLKGPPGCGKTLLARAVAAESEAHFISLNGPEIISRFCGQSEENLRKVFDEAKANAPTIIFMDEIDAIAPKREESHGEVERRVVSQLLTLMDGLDARGDVVVIAATNRPDSLDPALRRPGRFDRELEIAVPGREARREIFGVHTRGMPLARDVELGELVDVTYGFTGADVSSLCREAAMRALRRALPELTRRGDALSGDALERLSVSRADFVDALKKVEPSGMREVRAEVPRTAWGDVGGLADVKEALREAVEWPLKHPESFSRLGITPPRGVLLTGPPGSGKTLLARAVATEANANFISVKGPELLSKWVGESEKAVREVFKKARQVAPSVIFFDEFDSLASGWRDSGSGVEGRVVDQLLVEMDGLEGLHRVVVLAAASRPESLDPALLRPGRFGLVLSARDPDEGARLEVFRIHSRGMPLAKDVSLEELARLSEGFSGAMVADACREAGMEALREDREAGEVAMRHFRAAIGKAGRAAAPVNAFKRGEGKA
jgi:transitional endoplasmic reticulum ATPase